MKLFPAMYRKTFARDFSLALVELWHFGEVSDKRQWTDKEQPFKPYIVSNKTKDTVNIFVDPRGIDWIKSEILGSIKKDLTFAKKVGVEYKLRIEKVKDIIHAEPVLDLNALKVFLDQIRDAWAWFEALWWTIDALEHMPEYKKELATLLLVRKETERMAPATDAIIRKSVVRAYPDLEQDANVLRLEEIFENKIPSAEELSKRQNGYFYTNTTLYSGDSKPEIEKAFNIKIEDDVASTLSVLKGQTAFEGKVSGKVRKIFGIKQIPDFLDGEILVAATTTPDFLPALKKAAAIVSDEGGIICHAAIIARELKKPCIIGTKHAMEVLKDGDIVEVDADNGVVKTLK